MDTPKISDLNLKRLVIAKVREYPVIWDSKVRCENPVDIDEVWNEISSALNLSTRTSRIRLLWSAYRKRYDDILKSKTMQRDIQPPNWALFHDMSFLYEITKENIKEKLGGLEPPLFLPSETVINSPIKPCPCCLPSSTQSSQPSQSVSTIPNTNEMSAKQKRMIIAKVKEYPLIWDLNFRSASMISSINPVWNEIGYELNMPGNRLRVLWASFRRHYADILRKRALQRDTEPPKWEFFHDMSFLYEKTKEKVKKATGGLPPPIFETNEPLTSPCPCCVFNPNKTKIIELTINNPRTVTELTTIDLSDNRLKLIDLHQEEEQHFEAASVFDNNTSESTLSAASNRTITNSVSESDNYSNSMSVDQEQEAKSSQQIVSTYRERIIDSIRKYPSLYAKFVGGKKGCVSASWRKLSKEIGLPVVTLQNRWRLTKKRYVDELIKERNAKGPFKSTWENFDQMSFMREYMKASVDDVDRMREEIQTLVKKRKQIQTIDLCSDDEAVDEDADSLISFSDSQFSDTLQNKQPLDENMDADVVQLQSAVSQNSELCRFSESSQQPVSAVHYQGASIESDVTTMDLTSDDLVTEEVDPGIQQPEQDQHFDLSNFEVLQAPVIDITSDDLTIEYTNSGTSHPELTVCRDVPDPSPDRSSNPTTSCVEPEAVNNPDLHLTSYQQAFEQSITPKKDTPLLPIIWTVKKPTTRLGPVNEINNKKTETPSILVVELDLTSDEEDEVIDIKDDESRSDSDLEEMELRYSPVNSTK